MASATKFYQFVKALSGAGAAGQLNLNTDGLSDALFSGAPAVTDTAFNTSAHTLTGSGAAEVANGGGYTSGGNALSAISFTMSTGTGTLNVTDPTPWTGSGGGFGPFQYVVLYDTTAGAATTRTPMLFWNYGSSISLLAGETFTVAHGGSVLSIV